MIQELIYGGVLLPLARHAPRASRALRPAFARLAWVGHPAWRRSLRANARILLGPDSTPAAQDRLGLEVLRQVQEVIAEVATIDRRSVASLAADFRRLDGLQHVRPFLERKRPLILGGAHLGSFESSVAAHFSAKQAAAIIALFADAAKLDAMPVHEFVAAMVKN